MKPYELLVRFHPDGRVGACVYFYKEDGVTPDPVPRPVHTQDFPAQTRKVVSDFIGEEVLSAIEENSRVHEALATEEVQHAIKLVDAAHAELNWWRQPLWKRMFSQRPSLKKL